MLPLVSVVQCWWWWEDMEGGHHHQQALSVSVGSVTPLICCGKRYDNNFVLIISVHMSVLYYTGPIIIVLHDVVCVAFFSYPFQSQSLNDSTTQCPHSNWDHNVCGQQCLEEKEDLVNRRKQGLPAHPLLNWVSTSIVVLCVHAVVSSSLQQLW